MEKLSDLIKKGKQAQVDPHIFFDGTMLFITCEECGYEQGWSGEGVSCEECEGELPKSWGCLGHF